MMITPEHFRKVEIELRGLLDGGMPLGDALRVMHQKRQVGTMLLWPAVMAISQIDKKEAMRIVVHDTAAWLDDES